jgi:hypothetical protein
MDLVNLIDKNNWITALYLKPEQWLDMKQLKLVQHDLDYIIKKTNIEELNYVNNASPALIRTNYDIIMRSLDKRTAELNEAEKVYGEKNIQDIIEKIKLFSDILNKLKEQNEKIKIAVNKAKIGTLQGRTMQKLEETGSNRRTMYSIPLEDEPLHEILKNQQTYNERKVINDESTGGKRRKNKTKKRKTKIHKK